MPRSATTDESSFADLIRSIPSLLTCISPLLPAECVEGQVLEPRHLGLEEAQVHERGAAVVLALDVFDARAFDVEDRHSPAIRPADLDLAQLAAAHQAEGA
jgi:hypothetical protein